MKVKTLAWFESEVDQLVASLVQFNTKNGQRNENCAMLGETDLEKWSPTFRQLVKNLNNKSSSKWSCKSQTAGLFIFFLVLVVIIRQCQNWFQTSDESCLLGLPSSLQNAFVPPNKCDFCQNIFKIDHRQQLSPEEFTLKYAYSKVPVVVTDAMVNWTAPEVFSFDYFKEVYGEGEKLAQGKSSSCQFFPYKTEFRSLKEALSMDFSRAHYNDSNGSTPWYIGWSNCDYLIANELRRHYSKPYFLPLDAESIRTDWIFMGTPNNGAHMHIDHVGRPSWQAQIRGRKRWFLEPPLECYGTCTDHTVDVKEGHIIVLDTNVWYHKTLILGNEVSITIGAEYD